MQVLTIRVCDAHITGRPDVGYVKFPLTRMPADGCLTAWLPVQVLPCQLSFISCMFSEWLEYANITTESNACSPT